MVEVFRIPFMQHALLAGLLISVLCAFLAVFVVLKRIVFVGVALAQMSSAGVAMALLLGLSPTLLSLLFMLLGVAVFSIRSSEKKVPRESIIGIAYATAAALGILLVARSAQGESHMLNLLFGNILAVTPGDIHLMAGTFIGVGLIHCLFHKEFVFSSFDPEMAETLGMRARIWELIFYLTLGVTIALAIRTAGMLLVFAFLVVPGVFGLMLARVLKTAFVLAMIAAVIPVVLGLYMSFVLDLPSAATIVALSFLLVCLAVPMTRLRKS